MAASERREVVGGSERRAAVAVSEKRKDVVSAHSTFPSPHVRDHRAALRPARAVVEDDWAVDQLADLGKGSGGLE